MLTSFHSGDIYPDRHDFEYAFRILEDVSMVRAAQLLLCILSGTLLGTSLPVKGQIAKGTEPTGFHTNRILLNKSMIVAAKTQPRYLQYCVAELQNYLKEITG